MDETRKTVDKYEHLGEDAKVVDYITISPMGRGGQYRVGFITTNNMGEDDWETQGGGCIFNIKPQNLDKTWPYRMESNWIVARKDGKYELVGRYKDLHEEAKGFVEELLRKKGYTEPVEIEPMGFGAHVGWLEPPKQDKTSS